jgi:hypothetical protein
LAPVNVAENDIADIVQVAHLSGPADQVLLALFFDIAGTGVAVVTLQRRHQSASVNP